MRFVFALLIAIGLIGILFYFQNMMAARMAAWENAGVNLSALQKFLARVATAISRYWYVFAIVILCGSVAIAAALPNQKTEEPSG